MSFPFYKQLDTMDCGPSCLRAVSKFYGKKFSLQYLREKCLTNREGVSLLGISQAAESIGFKTISVRIDFDKLKEEMMFPCIAHWNRNHFVVIYKIRKNEIYVSDPAIGLVTYNRDEFIKSWGLAGKSNNPTGVVLLLEPTRSFYEEEDKEPMLDMVQIAKYFVRYRKLFLQLLLGLSAGTLLQLIMPFFAQAVVDIGIATKDIQFIYLLLIGQIMLFAGITIVDFVRGWILLHISTRINLSLLSDYWIKLMNLPVSYFDTKMTGDILQRVNDHKRIEGFLTGSAINTAFSLVNFIVFTSIIVVYDVKVFAIFLAGSIVYFFWVLFFLKIRRKLDYKRFGIAARNQSATIQLINGMQEIKLNNCEQLKRWSWERIQAKLFSLNVHSLAITQIQQGGALFINQLKNILVTFFSAKAVVDGQLTLGGMLAIQYIIGQLNSPIQQFIQFIQALQDAKISMERINEIHQMDDEEPKEKQFVTHLPEDKSITISSLCYKYLTDDNVLILDNIDLHIPQGKTTAIVGVSGSGKTTLLKMLLRFYQPSSGEIRVGCSRLDNISPSSWRSKCGVVMQDGFIFSDTFANNIAVAEEYPDWDRILHAVKVANIQEFIESLPLGYNTLIGAEGNGISQGQKQRILIARAVYKNPDFIFFDEATNALDANNEKKIMENMISFFKGRTVVVVAHRLSTVKHADQIVVLENGRIVECGTHQELSEKKGNYFSLVKNQLELGD